LRPLIPAHQPCCPAHLEPAGLPCCRERVIFGMNGRGRPAHVAPMRMFAEPRHRRRATSRAQRGSRRVSRSSGAGIRAYHHRSSTACRASMRTLRHPE
jgi:hypothetical protein